MDLWSVNTSGARSVLEVVGPGTCNEAHKGIWGGPKMTESESTKNEDY